MRSKNCLFLTNRTGHCLPAVCRARGLREVVETFEAQGLEQREQRADNIIRLQGLGPASSVFERLVLVFVYILLLCFLVYASDAHEALTVTLKLAPADSTRTSAVPRCASTFATVLAPPMTRTSSGTGEGSAAAGRTCTEMKCTPVLVFGAGPGV